MNRNIFWAGLATIAGKRFERDLLKPGTTPLRYRISTIGGEKVTESIAGTLIVAANQSRTVTKKPDEETLLASVLYRLSPRKRQEILELLAASLEADAESISLAKQVISSQSVISIQSVRGSLAFSVE